MSISDDTSYQRIIWHSRRGMLELDILLVPFVRQQYPLLDTTLQRSYIELLKQEDNQLYQWLALARPPEARFTAIVTRIREHVSKSTS